MEGRHHYIRGPSLFLEGNVPKNKRDEKVMDPLMGGGHDRNQATSDRG